MWGVIETLSPLLRQTGA